MVVDKKFLKLVTKPLSQIVNVAHGGPTVVLLLDGNHAIVSFGLLLIFLSPCQPRLEHRSITIRMRFQDEEASSQLAGRILIWFRLLRSLWRYPTSLGSRQIRQADHDTGKIFIESDKVPELQKAP